jgi:intein/homing endonuclease
MRIDWRNAMNIMSYTSIEDFTTFKKDKEYTGHELFSLIVPPAINLNRGGVKIKSGQLIEGRLSKDMLGSKKKNAIHQLIWDEYGAEETKKFIDDTQRLINNFNLYNGFSVGYGDVEIPASVKTQINKLFETKEQKVNHMITEIENNPDLMEKRVFEFKIFSELNIIRDDVSKMVMANLKPDNNFNIMILSGSKGDATNMGQISGCVGLQAHEGKLIPMKDNDRTLAYYHQNDDRAESRGLVKQSFVTGIEFPSFAYHLLAGREGLIDSSIKSVTGDTPIVILENGITNCVNIGDWIDEKLKIDSKLVKHYTERDMELLDLTKDVKIPTTDEDGNVNWCTISAITRHDPGKELYEIETLGGRKVIVTESKSLLIWNNSTKKFVHTSTPEVKLGDYVPVTMNLASPPKIQKYIEVSNYLPKEKYVYGTEYNSACRLVTKTINAQPQHESKYANLLPAGWWKLNNNSNFTLPHNSAYKLVRSMNRSNIENVKDGNVYPYSARRKDTKVPDKLELTRDNGLFMGLFLAEGNTDGKYIQITNLNKNIQNFVKQWFTKMSITYSEETKINKIGGTSACVRGFSTVLSSLLTKLMGHGARNKFVPVEAYNAPEEFIIGFLDGYFSGDGTVTKTEIRATSASKKLIEGINMLCSRLNMFGKISVTRMKSNNLGTKNIADINVISIRSKWAKIFAQKISLIDECKNKKLAAMKTTSHHIHFESVNDVVLDEIIAINKVDVTKYPKVYDLTVPDTLNFGLANGLHVVDTATTGYAQRRLVKSMEDLMIKYDGTVRTANDTLIQIVYGDSGADTTRQFEYTVKLMEMGDKELASVHKFTPDELKSFKGYKVNDEVFETVKAMRETIRYNMTKARADFIKITNTFMLPVNIARIVDNNLGNTKLNEGEKVDPTYVYKRLNDILTNQHTNLMCMTTDERDNKDSLKNKDEQVSKTVFKIALYDALSPKRCSVEYGMSQKQFDSIIDEIVDNFNRNIVQPGEMVGVIGAQSMGEPLTQMSVIRTSLVLIKNLKENKMYYGEIGTYIDDLLKKNDKHVKKVPNTTNSVVLDINDLYIIGVSDTEKTSWNKIQQISRHPANGKLIEIKTRSGRSVTTTLSHSHLARRDHKVVPIKGSDLKVGNRIPVTFLNATPRDGLKNIKIGDGEYKLTSDFGWLCGVYLADGCINGNKVNISKVIPEFKENIGRICSEMLNSEVSVSMRKGEYGDSHMSVFTHKDLAKFLSEELATDRTIREYLDLYSTQTTNLCRV